MCIENVLCLINTLKKIIIQVHKVTNYENCISCHVIEEKMCILSQVEVWVSHFRYQTLFSILFLCWIRILEIFCSLHIQGFSYPVKFSINTYCNHEFYMCCFQPQRSQNDLEVMIVSTLTLVFASKPFTRSICLCSKIRLCYCFPETFASQRPLSLQGLSLVWQVLNVAGLEVWDPSIPFQKWSK